MFFLLLYVYIIKEGTKISTRRSDVSVVFGGRFDFFLKRFRVL